jgi:tripartite-type tricarboxylate transporter receptor subunit TctC
MPEASTPQQFAAHIREELDRFRKLVKSAGIKEE